MDEVGVAEICISKHTPTHSHTHAHIQTDTQADAADTISIRRTQILSMEC